MGGRTWNQNHECDKNTKDRGTLDARRGARQFATG